MNKKVKITILILSLVLGIVFLIGILNDLVLNKENSSDAEFIGNSTILESEKSIIEDKELIIQPSSESVSELPVDKILNKKIPPRYEFGNSFFNKLQNGQIFSDVPTEKEKVSIRFSNQYEGILNKITLNIHTINEPLVIAGIQEDDGMGNPDGIWLNGKPSDAIVLKKGPKAREFSLDKVFLEKNNIYHIVIQHGTKPLQSPLDDSQDSVEEKIAYFRILNYRDNPGGYPFNPDDPDVFLPDGALNSLYFDGVSWEVLDRWPSFLLEYADGHLEGQPYTLAAPWAISGSTYVGQTIIPYSQYDVSKFSFVLSSKGQPNAPLYYGIQDYQGYILDNGIIATSDNLTWNQKLVEVNLENPISLEAGELYRFYVYSTIPKPENKTDFYRIFGQEFSFDYGLTYGGEIHRLTISHDEGKTWASWLDADTLFKITTTG